jgi:hypothetical protein
MVSLYRSEVSDGTRKWVPSPLRGRRCCEAADEGRFSVDNIPSPSPSPASGGGKPLQRAMSRGLKRLENCNKMFTSS